MFGLTWIPSLGPLKTRSPRFKGALAQKTNSWRATTRPARIASVKDAALIWNLSNIDHCHGLAQTGCITAAPIRCHR
jgi:hypothetical protein